MGLMCFFSSCCTTVIWAWLPPLDYLIFCPNSCAWFFAMCVIGFFLVTAWVFGWSRSIRLIPDFIGIISRIFLLLATNAVLSTFCESSIKLLWLSPPLMEDTISFKGGNISLWRIWILTCSNSEFSLTRCS